MSVCSSVGISVVRTGKVLACSFKPNGSIRDVTCVRGSCAEFFLLLM